MAKFGGETREGRDGDYIVVSAWGKSLATCPLLKRPSAALPPTWLTF